MFEGTVVRDSTKGYYWVEQDITHSRIFLHQRNVVEERYLHPGDRVRFELAPNPQKPDKTWAVNARWIGIVIARQVAEVRP